MLDKPPLEDEKIRASLRACYGVNAHEIEFLPLGYDNNASVYRVNADDGQHYFLKAKRDTVNPLSLSIPRYLQAQGIAQVAAPLPTITGDQWGSADEYALLLYPFIEGTSKFNAKLTDSQWRAFGAILKRLHDIQLSPELWAQMPKETFLPPVRFMALVKRIGDEITSRRYDHPSERQLAEFWNDHRADINRIVSRTEHLGRALQGKSLDFVLCHSDIHTGNLLIEPNGKLHVVDWDQPILAPKERDLMFMLDKPGEDLFLQGYGEAEIDNLTLTYYRYERTMEDVGGLAEIVLLPEASDESKHDALGWFMGNLAPGSDLDKADKRYPQLSLE